MSGSRRTRRSVALALSTTAALCVGLWTSGSRASQSPGHESDPAASPQFYTDHVQPIFASNCYRCHAGMNHRGGLQLDSRASILKGGKAGPVIVPGHPEDSLLIKLIRHEGPPDDPRPMPPKAKLSDADIATLAAWIKAGAVIPPDAPAGAPGGGR